VNEVDQLLVVSPTPCDHCGEAFAAEVPRRRKFRRWQCVELPPIRPEVTEYQLSAVFRLALRWRQLGLWR
jgi:hypothetical protein